MFSKILIPTDFSPFSQKVIDSIENFKKFGLKEVVLLYVIKPVETFSDIEIEEDYWLNIKEDAEKELKKNKPKLESLGIKVTTRIKTDTPYAEIIATAEEENADLILIGAHGKARDKKIHLGHVAEAVLRHSKTPVFIMKIIDDKIIPPFSKILFPTDFSECANQALNFVKELIKLSVKDIVLIHIQDIHKLRPHLADKIEEFNIEDRGRLEKIKEELTSLGANVKIILKEGTPFVEVNKTAKDEDIGLIVKGSHGRSYVKELILGSVCHRVARKAPTSVLVIKQK